MADDELGKTWLRHLVALDDQVAREFWLEYAPKLERLAARHLSAKLQRREAPEDVVQSVCRTFFRRARDGQFDLSDSGSLWRLLCAITLAKVHEKARFHLRDKRSCQREMRLADTPDDSLPGVHQITAAEPGPSEAVEMAEQLEQLVADMDEEERELVAVKLEERTNKEIAEQLRCSERTVRRISKRVQSRLLRILEESTKS